MRTAALPLGMIGLLAVLMAVLAFQQRETNRELQKQILALSGSNGVPLQPGAKSGVGQVRVSDQGLSSNERGELARLRAEVNLLKIRTQELATVAKAGGAGPLNLVPASAWKNAGRGSPEAAAESMLWAADNGDLDTLANTIVLDEAARARANEILGRLPESARATYSTPEKLVALLLARDTDARAMQVLGANAAGDDALVNLRLQKDDGKTKEEGYQFKRTADGWRLYVPGKAVDKMGKKLSDPPKK